MITILGASGFIGSRLTKRLDALGLKYRAVGRHDVVPAETLGHVIYCIGLTADFRSRPFDTVEAHVCKLVEVLRGHDFDSLLYLSSTRLYNANDESTTEENPLRIAPLDPSDLYNISKAMGESIVLNCGRPARVVRISNVYGSDFTSTNFLSSIIRDSISRRKIVLQTSAASAKDYVSIDDAVDGLISIATDGKEQIYNLASGINVSNGQLAEALRRLTGCTVEFLPEAPLITFPPIDISRMQREFDFKPSLVLDDLPQLIDLYTRNLESLHDQG
jgi:nucleoside-diphosphate-sugar epimerase